MKTASKTIIAFAMLCTLYVTTRANGIGEVVIPTGTRVFIHSVEPVSSKTNELGDRIEFTVTSDVLVNDQVVIKAGEPVDAFITSLEKPKGVGIPGKLTVEIRSVRTVEGSVVKLYADPIYTAGKNRLGLALGLGLGLGALYLPLLSLMAIKGKHAEMDTGYDIVATVVAETK